LGSRFLVFGIKRLELVRLTRPRPERLADGAIVLHATRFGGQPSRGCNRRRKRSERWVKVGEPPRNRTENPQIKSYGRPVQWRLVSLQAIVVANGGAAPRGP
jgi:hypothetical protein